MPAPFQSLWRRLWRDPPPTLACEFTGDAVAVARWTAGAVRPDELAVRSLPAGALRPSPVRENLVQPEEVARAVAAALEEVSRSSRSRRRDIALLLPDLSGRVSVLQFDRLPSKQEEAVSLVRFRLKKTVPFEVEDAAISFQVHGTEALVAVTPRTVVRQYEALFEEMGYLPGFVTLSTLAGLGLAAEPVGDPRAGTLLLRNGGRLLTIAVINQGRLRMLRASEMAAEDEDRTVDEVFQDVYASAIFYQDNYGGRIERVFLSGLEAQAEALSALVEADLGVRPRPLPVPARAPEQARFLGIYGLLLNQARK